MEKPEQIILTFEYMQNNLHSINLPSRNWSYSKGNHTFFGFQRVEENGDIKKRVAIRPVTGVHIFINEKLIPFSKYIKFSSMFELEELLKDVDDYKLSNVIL